MQQIKIQRLFRSLSLVVWLGIVSGLHTAQAETVTVDLRELQLELENASTSDDAVSRHLLDKITEAINKSDLGFSNGQLLYQNSDTDIIVEGGCNRTVILQLDTDVTLQSDTSLSLSLDSLYDPIVVSLNIIANVHSSGVARQIVGIRLGACQNLARDSFGFTADGPATFSLSATINLNPEWTDESTLSLYPSLSLDGEIEQFIATVSVNDTVLSGVLEQYIEDEINKTFTSARLSTELQGFEQQANENIADSLDEGRIDIELPEATNEQILALYQYLQPDARFPITLDLVRKNRQQLLSSILFGEPSNADAILADALLCESASVFFTDANTLPLYTGSAEQCALAAPDLVTGASLWADAACTNPIDYKPTSITEYCDVALDPDRLGNAASLPAELRQWTHSPGSRFDISALSLTGVTQPFMRRFNYKTIETDRGLCELEMRVYSESAEPELQKPLIALHGGSWQHRASGAIGIEATAPHFTSNGFTVFVPFYRLVGESDGNAACNDASLDDILEDVNDALDWVNEREGEFGLQGETTVFGQSAGGHLALSLAVNRPADVRRAILFYAPTDFKDFAEQIKSGEYVNPAGVKILEAITGGSIDELDTQSALVLDNSFPMKIANTSENLPPMFIMHGEMDSLLPARQSVRLCNAISGSEDFNDGPGSLIPNLTDLSSVVTCGTNGSQLHLIAEGEHALDLCLAPGVCLSGSEESAIIVAESMQKMLDWSVAPDVSVAPLRADGGFGAIYWQALISLLLILVIRRANAWQ